ASKAPASRPSRSPRDPEIARNLSRAPAPRRRSASAGSPPIARAPRPPARASVDHSPASARSRAASGSAPRPPGPSAPAPCHTLRRRSDVLYHVAIRIGATIAVELPGAAHLLDHRQVELRRHQLVTIFGRLGDDLTARVHEVAGAVELAD